MTDQEYKFYQRRLQQTSFSGGAYDWLVGLGERYKRRGEYPLSLVDYYSQPEDIEVAAVVETLLQLEHPNRDKAIVELYNTIGDNPSEMVSSRDFLPLMTPGAPQIPVLYRMHIYPSDVGNVLDWCWNARYGACIGIEKAVMNRPTNFPSLSSVVSGLNLRHRFSMMKMRLGCRDGVGHGVWDLGQSVDFVTPWFPGMRSFFSAFYLVNVVNERNFEEVSEYLGFDIPSDVIYAYWAYSELKHRDNDSVCRFEKQLRRRMRWNIFATAKGHSNSYFTSISNFYPKDNF